MLVKIMQMKKYVRFFQEKKAFHILKDLIQYWENSLHYLSSILAILHATSSYRSMPYSGGPVLVNSISSFNLAVKTVSAVERKQPIFCEIFGKDRPVSLSKLTANLSSRDSSRNLAFL